MKSFYYEYKVELNNLMTSSVSEEQDVISVDIDNIVYDL